MYTVSAREMMLQTDVRNKLDGQSYKYEGAAKELRKYIISSN